ncbi:hypothetical protein [Pleomorphomonas koreensis]|uniref:hypothetical protein n=1 Tax=Pleomorphomonas koreensis TaxID=257440 RepID=UPI0003FC8D23|nr:hypothetical protein [Pleomorphomonas koreensis]
MQLPPDVEPIDRPLRGDGAGIILALFAALSGGFVIGFIAFGLGVMVGKGAL